MKNIYEEVTNQIIEAFEKVEIGEWECPWSGGFPTNALTKKAYRGLNVILLLIAAQRNNFKGEKWLTYRQAVELGGSVRKGEKGTKIVFYKMIKSNKKLGEEDRVKKGKKNENQETEEQNTFPMMRYYTVFNAEQCDGLNIKTQAQNEVSINEDIENFLGNIDFELRTDGQTIAAYNFRQDFIRMPKMELFDTENDYYSTLFHELGHWTGHETRLDRELQPRFKEETYAAEELVAEFTSAFLSAQFGVGAILKHAVYIKDWKRLLKSDPYAVATCARKATEAAEYLTELASSESVLSAA